MGKQVEEIYKVYIDEDDEEQDDEEVTSQGEYGHNPKNWLQRLIAGTHRDGVSENHYRFYLADGSYTDPSPIRHGDLYYATPTKRVLRYVPK